MAGVVLLVTKRMEIIDKREFALVVLNTDDENFIIYIAPLAKQIIMPIYPSCQAQVATLISEETGISSKYFKFPTSFFQTPRQTY